MTTEEIKLLEENGWSLECESPLELRHENGSLLTNMNLIKIILKDLQNDNN